MQVTWMARGAAAHDGVQIGPWSDRQAALAPKTPIDAARSGYAADVTAKFAFERWRPRDELKAETVVDHREPARGQRQPPAIDAGDVFARRRRTISEASFAREAFGDGTDLASAKRIDQVASEVDPASIVADQALSGEVVDALVQRLADFSAKTTAG